MSKRPPHLSLVPKAAPGAAGERHPRPAPAPVPGAFADQPAPPPRLAERPDTQTIRHWLAQIPDPEIPVLTIADLGIIRGVRWQADGLDVTVTPTYSGCPATTAIERAILDRLTAEGLADIRITRQLSPPWTTDWLTEEAHDKLRRYGIAPPQARGDPPCPRCGAQTTERISQFGSTPCKAQWRCIACLEPFDHFKCH